MCVGHAIAEVEEVQLGTLCKLNCAYGNPCVKSGRHTYCQCGFPTCKCHDYGGDDGVQNQVMVIPLTLDARTFKVPKSTAASGTEDDGSYTPSPVCMNSCAGGYRCWKNAGHEGKCECTDWRCKSCESIA